MSRVKELIQRVPPSRYFWQGVIASDVTDLSDTVWVVVPGFDPKFRWGPCRWQSRDLTSLPQRGDKCLLILDDQGEGWVTAWWPFAT